MWSGLTPITFPKTKGLEINFWFNCSFPIKRNTLNIAAADTISKPERIFKAAIPELEVQ